MGRCGGSGCDAEPPTRCATGGGDVVGDGVRYRWGGAEECELVETRVYATDHGAESGVGIYATDGLECDAVGVTGGGRDGA